VHLDIAGIYSGRYGAGAIDIPHDEETIDRDGVWSREFTNILAILIISRLDKIDHGERMLEEVHELLELIDHSH
jgi:hypothetical protein